jgi:RNA polymerase sigma factor (sigma-70 family)
VQANDSTEQSNSRAYSQDSSFPNTHWTCVLSAAEGNSAPAEVALAQLCERYWYPLFIYARRRGHSPEDAADLVQGFFAKVLEKNYLNGADPLKGRFRSFLLMMLDRFAFNEWDRTNRQKRGGGVQVLSIDVGDTELRYLAEPADQLSPERACERAWATLLLARVLDRVEEEFRAAGKVKIFDELKVFLTGEKSEVTRAEICQKLAMSETNLKVSVHRLRQRYREVLRAEIALTVDSPDAIDEEIRNLFAAVS